MRPIDHKGCKVSDYSLQKKMDGFRSQSSKKKKTQAVLSFPWTGSILVSSGLTGKSTLL